MRTLGRALGLILALAVVASGILVVNSASEVALAVGWSKPVVLTVWMLTGAVGVTIGAVGVGAALRWLEARETRRAHHLTHDK